MLLYLINFSLNLGFWVFRAAAIPRAKGGARLQMKLVYNHLAPLFLFLLQWMDCSCTCLLPRYLSFFHILVYKVGSSTLSLMQLCFQKGLQLLV